MKLKYVGGKVKRVVKYVKFSSPFVLIPLLIAVFLFGILIGKLSFVVPTGEKIAKEQVVSKKKLVELQNKVIKDKYTFNIKVGDLGKRMVDDGVIDKTKLAQAVTGQEKLPGDLEKYFNEDSKQIDVNLNNSQFWVDFFWGLGLANKNKILEEGQMMENDDASQFASTGGWTLGAGDAMNYYSKFNYINLSEKQQKEVEEIASNIYRPCCGNSTAFPDCNHGMAALGLIELMVSQGKTKDDIYKTVLAFNTYWFPNTYLNVAYHFDKAGQDYSSISPKELLSKTFSSAMGAQAIAKETEGVQWPAIQGAGSCGA